MRFSQRAEPALELFALGPNLRIRSGLLST